MMYACPFGSKACTFEQRLREREEISVENGPLSFLSHFPYFLTCHPILFLTSLLLNKGSCPRIQTSVTALHQTRGRGGCECRQADRTQMSRHRKPNQSGERGEVTGMNRGRTFRTFISSFYKFPFLHSTVEGRLCKRSSSKWRQWAQSFDSDVNLFLHHHAFYLMTNQHRVKISSGPEGMVLSPSHIRGDPSRCTLHSQFSFPLLAIHFHPLLNFTRLPSLRLRSQTQTKAVHNVKSSLAELFSPSLFLRLFQQLSFYSIASVFDIAFV